MTDRPTSGLLRRALRAPSRLALLLALALVVAGTLARIVFALWFGPGAPGGQAGVGRALVFGLRFDARVAIWTMLPIWIVASLPWLGRRLAPVAPAAPAPAAPARPSVLWRLYWQAAASLWALAAIVDFGFYAYLSQRLSSLAFTLAADGREAVGTLWGAYPVVQIAVGLAGYCWAMDRLFLRLHRLAAAEPAAPPPVRRRRWRSVGSAVVAELALVFAAGLVLMGKWSLYPLRWSDAAALPSPFAQALALNPLHSVRDSWQARTTGIGEREVKVDADLIRAYVGLPPLAPDAPFSLLRSVPAATDARPRPRNVVLVLLESFSAHKTGTFGNPLGVTPHFDALAKDGLLFTRTMTAHGGTARGVFATLTGLPDVSDQGTASANPSAVSQHLIWNEFKDHDKFYFIGGSTTWANVRGFLTAGVDGLEIYEEGRLQSPSTTGPWGVSDKDLLLEAKGILDRGTRPFFAVVQTAGNHRPYTIPPADAKAMGLIEPSAADLFAQGFVSALEFNAFRYLDWSIGQFMAAARSAPWFDDTLFVFIGDHGIAGRTGPHMPPAFGLHLLTHGHTPLLFYSPRHVAPGRRDAWAQQVDVMPTIAAMMGIAHRNTSLGRDLLDPRFDAQRSAFTFRYPGPSGVGLLTDHYYVHKIDGSPGLQARVFDLAGADPLDELDAAALAGLPAEQWTRLLLAYARTTTYLLTRNPKLP